MTNRERLRILGVAVGAIVTIVTAIEGQLWPAIAFGLATVAVAVGVVFERRSGR